MTLQIDAEKAESLDCLVTELPRRFDRRRLLLDRLWCKKPCQTGTANDWHSKDWYGEAYLEYYNQQCEAFHIEQSDCMVSTKTIQVLIEKHEDILSVVDKVRSNSERRDIVQQLVEVMATPTDSTNLDAHDSHSSAQIVDVAVNWAARVVTMMEIGQLQCAFHTRQNLTWEHGTLHDFVALTFQPATSEGSGLIRLEKTFNILSLEKLAGISVQWTNDLASHLTLRDDDKTILIFHHATFLRNTSRNAWLTTTSDIFPDGFCDETLRTLALLFPAKDRDIRRWFRKRQSAAGLDPAAVQCPHLPAEYRRIENFHFWRERLSIIKQVFDEAEPSTLSQWWYDRRKGPQWYTFWVAVVVLILTVFFGVIQSVEGGIQAYKAWNPS